MHYDAIANTHGLTRDPFKALGRFSCVSGEEGCIGPPVSVCAEVP